MLQTIEISTEGKDERALPGYRNADIILFEEGLVGFPQCKRFVLMENESLAPFRVLQCIDQPNVGFLVLDPRQIVKNYNRSIPSEAWRSIDVTDAEDRLSLAISIIGSIPEESSANLQAPLLINYKKMKGRQLILTGSRYSVTQPLLSRRTKASARTRTAGSSVH